MLYCPRTEGMRKLRRGEKRTGQCLLWAEIDDVKPGISPPPAASPQISFEPKSVPSCFSRSAGGDLRRMSVHLRSAEGRKCQDQAIAQGNDVAIAQDDSLEDLWRVVLYQCHGLRHEFEAAGADLGMLAQCGKGTCKKVGEALRPCRLAIMFFWRGDDDVEP